MNRTSTSVKLASDALAAIAFIVGTTASAQTNSAATNEMIGGQNVTLLTERNTRTGMEVETLRISKRVNFADIDIGTPKGEAVLHKRIEVAASTLCGQLGVLDPENSAQEEMTERSACVERAYGQAAQAVAPAIAAARKADNDRQ